MTLQPGSIALTSRSNWARSRRHRRLEPRIRRALCASRQARDVGQLADAEVVQHGRLLDVAGVRHDDARREAASCASETYVWRRWWIVKPPALRPAVARSLCVAASAAQLVAS